MTLFWKLFAGATALIALCLGVVGWWARESTSTFHEQTSARALANVARVAAARLAPLFDREPEVREGRRRLAELGLGDGLHATLIWPSGLTIGPVDDEPVRVDGTHSDPEMIAGLEGAVAWDVRYSSRRQGRYLYLAWPVMEAGAVRGVLRIAEPLARADAADRRMMKGLWRAGLIGLGLALVVSALLARRHARAAQDLTRLATRLGDGHMGHRNYQPLPPELEPLGWELNRMAERLDRQIRDIVVQRNEREAILASMAEGVLAIDLDERIRLINSAAERLLRVRAEAVVGRLVQEALRHAELHRLLGKILGGQPIATEESILHWPDEKLLQVESTPLRNEANEIIGFLLVLNDVTRIHHLENMRRQFVANVSHELRTPVTAISGFIETLRDGAIHDPQAAEQFLGIIERQTSRLGNLISDLLLLSRVESDCEMGAIQSEHIQLANMLEGLLQEYHPRLEQQGMQVALDCDPNLELTANERLLEQAVGNLLDNTIKYSGEGSRVGIGVEVDEEEVRIRIGDNGPGIPREHCGRIFERFYRVDAAASRQMGGTGLGLAIVKHIAQAHGGGASVTSTVGRGSTFTIHLPARLIRSPIA